MMANWELLPPDVLVSIFTLLNDEDLFHASCACRSWNNVSKIPCLWRRRTFIFRGYCRSYADRIKNITECIRSVGSHIKELTLSCPSPNLLTASNVTKCVSTLFNEILKLQMQHRNAALKSFVLKDLVFEEFWSDFRSSKRQLAFSLTWFLGSHHKLTSIDISNAFITAPFSFRIMEAMIKNRYTKKLEMLNMENFFSSSASPLRLVRTVHSLFSSFSRLKRLSINECYLSDNSIGTLCSRLNDTLEQLDLHVYCPSNWDKVSPIGWREALDFCPRLKVTMNVNFWSGGIKDHLLTELPLTELNIRGFVCGTCKSSYSSDITRLLRYLSQTFPSSLSVISLMLRFGYMQKSPLLHREELKSFWVSCPNLEKVNLSKDVALLLDGSRHNRRVKREAFDLRKTWKLDSQRCVNVKSMTDSWRLDHFCFYLTTLE